MNDFCFANFFLILKECVSFDYTKEELGRRLFSFFHIKNQDNNLPISYDIDFSESKISKMINRTEGGGIPKIIQKKIEDPSVTATIRRDLTSYFAKHITPIIIEERYQYLIDRMSEMIKSDTYGCTLSQKYKSFLVDNAKKTNISKFLALVFYETLKCQNRISSNRLITNTNAEIMKTQRLQFVVPEMVYDKESKYINALLEMYSEEANDSISTFFDLNFYPENEKHCQRQRKYFYAAEAVNSGVKDIYNYDYFGVFLDEVYEGIIEVYEDSEYITGRKRLNEVMKRAVETNTDACWIIRETAWIGNSQKKGACHMLVDADRLDGWVYKK